MSEEGGKMEECTLKYVCLGAEVLLKDFGLGA